MRPGRADLAAICAYLVLGVWVLAEYWVDVDHRISAHTPLDQTWFEWLLAHAVYTVRHLENPLFSLRQNAPLGVNLMANTSALAITLPLSPITIVFGPSVSYAVWVSGGTAATAAATYWVLSRHVVTSRAAAFLGGGLVGFAPGVIHHANGQPVFVANFLLPFIAVRAVRLGTTGRWLREGITLGLLVAWQLFINEELLLLTALASGVAVVVSGVSEWRHVQARLRPFFAAIGVTAVVAGAFTGYAIWFQFFGPQTSRGWNAPILYAWGEDLQSFVTFSRDTLAGSAAVEETLGRTEQNSWFGWPLCALLVLSSTALWRRSPSARTAAIVALVFLPLSLGRTIRVGTSDTGIPGVWSALPADLPVVEMVMVSRFALVIAAVAGLLVALAYDEIPRWASSPRRRLLLRAAVVLPLIPLIPRPIPAQGIAPPPDFILSGAWRAYVAPDRTLIPVPLPGMGEGLKKLRWSAIALHEFAVPGGYFIGPGRDGRGQIGPLERPTARLLDQVARSGRVPTVTDEMRRLTRDDVRYWNGDAIVLARHLHGPALKQLLDELFGRGEYVDDVWLWRVGPRDE